MISLGEIMEKGEVPVAYESAPMQKGQPNARLSLENNDLSNPMYRQETPTSYAQGFSAGYEAGRRASLDEVGTHQRMAGSTERRFSAGSPHPPHSARVSAGARPNRPGSNGSPKRGPIPPHFAHESDGHAPPSSPNGRRSFDEPIRHSHAHEVQGQRTDPNTAVPFKSRGQY